jgi:hypothetical protein
MLPSPQLGTVVRSGDGLALTAALRETLTRAWDRPLISNWGRSRTWDAVAKEVLEEAVPAAARVYED